MMKFYRIVLICTLIISCRAANLSGSGSGSGTKKALEDFIGTSDFHTCGLTNDGNLECFGSTSTYHKEPNNKERYKPREPGATFTQISLGNRHMCGLTNKGGIDCFGAYGYVTHF